MVFVLHEKDCREMNDEEIKDWRVNVLEKNIEGNSTEWHRRALLTMQNPVRREILMLLKDKALSIKEITDNLRLDEKIMQFHLEYLKLTYFITIEENMVDLTPFGVVYLKNVIR